MGLLFLLLPSRAAVRSLEKWPIQSKDIRAVFKSPGEDWWATFTYMHTLTFIAYVKWAHMRSRGKHKLIHTQMLTPAWTQRVSYRVSQNAQWILNTSQIKMHTSILLLYSSAPFQCLVVNLIYILNKCIFPSSCKCQQLCDFISSACQRWACRRRSISCDPVNVSMLSKYLWAFGRLMQWKMWRKIRTLWPFPTFDQDIEFKQSIMH